MKQNDLFNTAMDDTQLPTDSQPDIVMTRFGALLVVMVMVACFWLGLRAGNVQVCLEAHAYRADFQLSACEPFSEFVKRYNQ